MFVNGVQFVFAVFSCCFKNAEVTCQGGRAHQLVVVSAMSSAVLVVKSNCFFSMFLNSASCAGGFALCCSSQCK